MSKLRPLFVCQFPEFFSGPFLPDLSHDTAAVATAVPASIQAGSDVMSVNGWLGSGLTFVGLPVNDHWHRYFDAAESV